MISPDVQGSDAFIELSHAAQALYTQLVLNADDDEFVGAPKKAQRMICAEDRHRKELIDSGFLYQFASGVVVLRHWIVCNKVPRDRYHVTIYQNERSMLQIDNGNVYIMSTECRQSDNSL